MPTAMSRMYLESRFKVHLDHKKTLWVKVPIKLLWMPSALVEVTMHVTVDKLIIVNGLET